jgi:predicted ATPase
VVTLTGVGGVGKTRLALHAAGQLAPRFGDNTWLCQLAPVRDASGVDDAVATIFSVTARARQSIREALVDFLRPLASEALALARQIGAPGLIATGLP